MGLNTQSEGRDRSKKSCIYGGDLCLNPRLKVHLPTPFSSSPILVWGRRQMIAVHYCTVLISSS